MKSKFRPFGFEIQVKRVVWYAISTYSRHDVDPVESWDVSMFFIPAWFQAWKRARFLAKLDNVSTTYAVYRLNERGDSEMVYCKTIAVSSVISFFGI